MMALTTTLCTIAILTNALLVLPLIAFPLIMAAGSSTIQLIWKKVFNKKLFIVAPVHHHFEALGWPSYKVTMRFWIIGVFSAVLGVIVHILG
jgi:phospho-N-acetylmuramoyl-pentapeptide-transferase